MANYLLCRKKFISLGEAQIELADININTITVQSENEKKDCTVFLEHGSTYNTLQTQTNMTFTTILGNIQIKSDKDGKYFEYTGSAISVEDNLVLTGNNNNNVYCVVNNIVLKKIYFDFYSVSEDIVKLAFTRINVIKYDNMRETTVTYELTIDTDVSNYYIPVFLPVMNQTMSSRKEFLIHIKNSTATSNFIFLSRENFYMNNLTKNIPYILSYTHDATSQQTEYTTFMLCMVFNGNKSWFIA